MTIFAAARRYAETDTPLVVIGGKEYGTGSSRDWAAKGAALLGVKAVLVESFERIHRSNLVGMGVLPLQFLEGQSAAGLGIDGTEVFDIARPEVGADNVVIEMVRADGSKQEFTTRVRIDTPKEWDYYCVYWAEPRPPQSGPGRGPAVVSGKAVLSER